MCIEVRITYPGEGNAGRADSVVNLDVRLVQG